MAEKRFPEDHKRVKKKLIAPMNHAFQDRGWEVNFFEISYEKVVVPEVFWITYLNAKIGSFNASLVILKIIKLANKINTDSSGNISGLASSFHRLDDNQKKELIKELEKEGIIEILNKNISGIKHLFADFPLNFLITKPDIYQIGELQYLKKTLNKLNDRLSIDTTFTFAHLIYALISVEIITLHKSSVIFNINELSKYPNTEESEIIASHLRSMSKLIDKPLLNEDIFGWRNSFWKQCFKLEPCKI